MKFSPIAVALPALCLLLATVLITADTYANDADVFERLPIEIEAVGINGRTLVVAPDGKPDAAGTEDDPLSLQAAADQTQPGDTVLLRGGTYRNADNPGEFAVLIIRNPGTAENWIRYANYPGEHPVFDFNSLRAIQVAGASHLVIEGLEIDGRNDEVDPKEAWDHAEAFKGDDFTRNEFFGVGIRVSTSDDGGPKRFAHHIIIRNNHVHHCSGGGIATGRADYLLIEDNIVHHNAFYTPWGGSGISIWTSANHDDRQDVYRTVVRRNICFQNDNLVEFWMLNSLSDGNGIILDALQNTQDNLTQDGYNRAYEGRILVADNLCFYNGGRGVNVFESDNADIVNNTLFANAQRGNIENEIEFGRAHNMNVHFNVIVPLPDKRAFGGYQSENVVNSHNMISGGEEHPNFKFGPSTLRETPRFIKKPKRATPGHPPVDLDSFDFSLRPNSPGAGVMGARLAD
ncbi:MAG: right-handed parallel beta-helix repeat-containing protein [Planctomycetota bacterium]